LDKTNTHVETKENYFIYFLTPHWLTILFDVWQWLMAISLCACLCPLPSSTAVVVDEVLHHPLPDATIHCFQTFLDMVSTAQRLPTIQCKLLHTFTHCVPEALASTM